MYLSMASFSAALAPIGCRSTSPSSSSRRISPTCGVVAAVALARHRYRRYLDVTVPEEQPYRIASLWSCRKARKNLDGTKQRPTIKKKTGWKSLKMKIVKRIFGFIGKLCLAFISLVAWIGRRAPWVSRHPTGTKPPERTFNKRGYPTLMKNSLLYATHLLFLIKKHCT